MNGTLAIARYTLVELSRRRILLVFLIIGVLGLLAFGVGFKLLYSVVLTNSSAGPSVNREAFDRYVELSFLSNLYSVLGIFALLLGYGIGMTALYHDLDSGAAVSIFSKPVSRFAYTVGKIAAAVAGLTATVGLLAIETRLVMLLFHGGLENSLTVQVIATTANTVVVMLIVLSLTAWMNNIVAAVVAFIYYNVVTGVVTTLHVFAESGQVGNQILKAIFEAMYWLVPHALVSSFPGDLIRAQMELAPAGEGGPRASQISALIPPASGFGDVVWWAFTVLVFAGLLYYLVRRRQV